MKACVETGCKLANGRVAVPPTHDGIILGGRQSGVASPVRGAVKNRARRPPSAVASSGQTWPCRPAISPRWFRLSAAPPRYSAPAGPAWSPTEPASPATARANTITGNQKRFARHQAAHQGRRQLPCGSCPPSTGRDASRPLNCASACQGLAELLSRSGGSSGICSIGSDNSLQQGTAGGLQLSPHAVSVVRRRSRRQAGVAPARWR